MKINKEYTPPDGWDEFVATIQERLEVGAREYGDSTFDMNGKELVGEIAEELLDICGWSFFLWLKLRRIRKKLPE